MRAWLEVLMARVDIKNIVSVAVSAIIAFYACAEEVSADSAGVAARRWLEDDAALGCNLGVEVDSVRTCQSAPAPRRRTHRSMS